MRASGWVNLLLAMVATALLAGSAGARQGSNPRPASFQIAARLDPRDLPQAQRQRDKKIVPPLPRPAPFPIAMVWWKRLLLFTLFNSALGFICYHGAKLSLPVSTLLYVMLIPLYGLAGVYLLGLIAGVAALWIYLLAFPIMRYIVRSRDIGIAMDQVMAARRERPPLELVK